MSVVADYFYRRVFKRFPDAAVLIAGVTVRRARAAHFGQPVPAHKPRRAARVSDFFVKSFQRVFRQNVAAAPHLFQFFKSVSRKILFGNHFFEHHGNAGNERNVEAFYIFVCTTRVKSRGKTQIISVGQRVMHRNPQPESVENGEHHKAVFAFRFVIFQKQQIIDKRIKRAVGNFQDFGRAVRAAAVHGNDDIFRPAALRKIAVFPAFQKRTVACVFCVAPALIKPVNLIKRRKRAHVIGNRTLDKNPVEIFENVARRKRCVVIHQPLCADGFHVFFQRGKRHKRMHDICGNTDFAARVKRDDCLQRRRQINAQDVALFKAVFFKRGCE